MFYILLLSVFCILVSGFSCCNKTKPPQEKEVKTEVIQEKKNPEPPKKSDLESPDESDLEEK